MSPKSSKETTALTITWGIFQHIGKDVAIFGISGVFLDSNPEVMNF
jgi:hypothetical protein